MKSNELDPRALKTSGQKARPRKRVGGGLGSGVWAGYAMALLLGGRTLVSLARSVGPVAGMVLLLSLFGGVPVLLGIQSWRERREERARAARWAARARQTRERKPPTG